MKYKFLDSLGMSLIEIMVAAGILSFVGLAVSTTLTDVVKMQNATTAKDESNEFASAIARFLFTESTCTESLRGQTFPLSNSRALQMPRYLGYGANSVARVEAGFNVTEKLRVLSLDLVDKGMPPVSMRYEGSERLRVLGQINLNTQLTIAGKATANPTRSFELPLLINPSDNRIVKCLSNSSVRDACIAMGTRLDPVTGQCVPESQCVFEGSYTLISCSPNPVTRPCDPHVRNPITNAPNCPSGASTSRQTGTFATSFSERLAKKRTQLVNVSHSYFLCLKCN